VNFWNLRAANIDLIFYDPVHDPRFHPSLDHWMKLLKEVPEDSTSLRGRISVWQAEGGSFDVAKFGTRVLQCTATDGVWNGLNVRPPQMYISGGHSVIGAVSRGAGSQHIHFQLPKKPFYPELELHDQKLVVSVRIGANYSGSEEASFRFPFLPELNEHYGREALSNRTEARSERRGLGVITDVNRDDLRIHAVSPRAIIGQVFELAGMRVESSPAGRIANRLIHQMGGLQGCRVFKIPGVRELIEKYGPLQSFTRSDAICTIGANDPVTHKPDFKDFENLFIKHRDGGKLKPEHAFTYLLKKKVFRVGLKLVCPNCELDCFLPMDNLATEIECELCGKEFNVTPQLRDRDWRYRRSGLFGKEDHQGGSVPVVLTLQQIDTVFSSDQIFTTGLDIFPATASAHRCETDFVIVTDGATGEKSSWQ
jgi:hypothetical protein